MKKIVIALNLVLCFGFISQQESGFEYELSELKDQGVVLLTNGDTLKGELVYWPNKNERAWIDVGNKHKGRREIHPNEVRFFHFTSLNRSFEADQEVYESGKKSDSAFYERLNPLNSKFRIYQQFSSTGKIVGGKLEGHNNYFVCIPGHLTITGLSAKALRPFNEKLPAFLTDCPVLSDKVKNEEKGYKIPAITNNYKRLEVLNKIAAEYEDCGK
jgi:hypothetical protein